MEQGNRFAVGIDEFSLRRNTLRSRRNGFQNNLKMFLYREEFPGDFTYKDLIRSDDLACQAS